jgi:site-specific DNA-methyltransferase (adenine-specific)
VSTNRKAAIYSDTGDRWRLVEGDSLHLMATLPDSCVDAICTDPPYGLGFHGESWDGAGKAGSHLADGTAFAAWTKAWAAESLRLLKPGGHLLAFGSPRTFHRLTSGVEDAGLEVRDVVMWVYGQGAPKARKLPGGLAAMLRPAYEPILLARKPLAGTTLRNVEKWGTGALNTEASRVNGYWPAHLALSHASGCTTTSCTADCPRRLLDAAHPELRPNRMFFCAKASKREREAGCDELPLQSDRLYSRPAVRLRRNIHPTVKPVSLMRWLVALVTPPDGVVLDPFAGSASTGIAALVEGRAFLGVEREPNYIDIACARLTHWGYESVKESG